MDANHSFKAKKILCLILCLNSFIEIKDEKEAENGNRGQQVMIKSRSSSVEAVDLRKSSSLVETKEGKLVREMDLSKVPDEVIFSTCPGIPDPDRGLEVNPWPKNLPPFKSRWRRDWGDRRT